MAIKINWDNLYRRVWNWQDVQKVILNWAVIRPYEQPHVDYHVISDFTGWWGGWVVPSMPWGWWGTWVEITDDGVVPTWSSWTLTYTQDSGMPSLANAIKLEMVVTFEVDGVSEIPSYSNLVTMVLSGRTTAGFSASYLMSWQNRSHFPTVYQWSYTGGRVNSPIDWEYTWKVTLDWSDTPNQWTSVVECPSGVTSTNGTVSIPAEAIEWIKQDNRFVVTMLDWVTIKRIDFFITNNYDQPTPPPTPTPTEWIPTGYHVPTYSELSGLYSLMSSDLWINMQSTDVLEYLHIPECWTLSAINWRYISSSLSTSWIWCSDYHNSRPASWIIYGWIGSNMSAIESAFWCNVRPFKDTYEAPDGTWTVEYWNLSTGWIFRNQQSWLISIFYWNTGYTMADRNRWASYAWSSGDTISVNNSGYLYQWWNCYGFPLQDATTTSSTKVDTTGYGSWTLYTSSTFITAQSGDWMNPVNTTLWS